MNAHDEALLVEALQKREDAIVNGVLAKITSGALDPQFAVQAWLQVAEVRNFRRVILKRDQQRT